MFDLQLHTRYSDGRYEPAELISRILLPAGVRLAAATDHDTWQGARSFLSSAETASLTGVAGIEVSTLYQEGSDWLQVDILAFGGELERSDLREFEDRLRALNDRRFLALIDYLNRELGGGIDPRPIKVQAEERHIPIHLAHVILAALDSGLIKSPDEVKAWYERTIVNNPSALEVMKPRLATREAVGILNELGLITILAHPHRYPDPVVEEVVRMEVRGIEALYGRHSEEERERYLTLARDKGLLVSGGSDYHGFFEDTYRPPEGDAELLLPLLDALEVEVSWDLPHAPVPNPPSNPAED